MRNENLEWIRDNYGDPMKVFSSLTRGMIVASPGKELFCADFSAVEARLAFWIAEHEQGIRAFREGRKLYEEMAEAAFGMPASLVTKDSLERFVGKESILGCIAKGAPVLTQNGFVPIETITLNDWLWSGEKWVKHQGLLRKGLKPVIKVGPENIEMTPDHRILQYSGWFTAVEIDSRGVTQHQRLELKTEVRELYLGNLNAALSAVSWCAAYAELKKNFELIDFGKGQTLCACPALRKYINPTAEIRATEISFLIQNLNHVGKLVSTTLGVDASTIVVKTGKGMAVAAFNAASNPLEHFWNTLLLCAGLTNPVSTWTELIMMGTMSPETYESLLSRRIVEIKETFDLYRSGDKFCYQVGNHIVSNCQYGLGFKKFMANCHFKGMKSVTPTIAKKAVYTYREVHYPVPAMWKALEQAVIQAIRQPGQVFKVTKVRVYVHDGILTIKLPSSRKLKYHKPRVSFKQLESGRMVPQIHYFEAYQGNWRETVSWGGVFFNHIVQGTARDLMANSMVGIENAGYEVLLTIHDEVLAERKTGRGSLKEYISLMTDLPDWALGFPSAAEGWTGFRYHK